MLKAAAAPATLFAFLVIASSPAARADDTQARTRVTIRGTGANVTIDRTLVPAGKRAFPRNAPAAGPLSDAIRLEAEGADDATLIAYLSAHQADLPPVIDARDVTQLRKAGAGKSVVAYLATVAAVDIGPTGEGRGAASYPPPGLVVETPAYEAAYGYPLIGSYGSPFPARLGGRGFFLRRMSLRLARPVRPGGFPRALSARRPVAE